MKSSKKNPKTILSIKSSEIFHSSVGALALSPEDNKAVAHYEDINGPLAIVGGKQKTMPVLKLNFNDPDSKPTITNHASHSSHASHASHHSRHR
jgi:hypothetical protein